MIPIDIFTDPEQWYEHSETLTSTDDLLELYHKTIDNVEINEDFDEASGFLDVFFTLQDHLVAAKRFDDLINLINKFKTKHQDYYQNHCFQYFQTELLKYYLYIGDETKARAAFELLAGNPLADIDSFLPSVQLILLYDKKEWVAEIAEKTFRTLHESDEIMGDGSLVGIHIFNNALEKGFEQFQTTGTCDWQTINDYLKKYEYQIDEKAQSDMEVAFAFDYNNDTLRSNKMNHQIATAFSKYMLLEKKMSFMTSYFLFSEMGEYWAKHKSKSKGQFNLNSQKFDQFCASPFTMFNPYKSGVTARLWGAQYVYDFLFKTGLINQTAFEDATDIINSLKKSLTKNPNHLCWEYGFYRFWEKADGESTEAYEIHIKHSQDSFEKVDIVEKKPFDSKVLFDNLVSSMKHDVPRSSVSAESPKKELKQVEVRTAPKVGRNEPCTCGSGKKYKKCCGA